MRIQHHYPQIDWVTRKVPNTAERYYDGPLDERFGEVEGQKLCRLKYSPAEEAWTVCFPAPVDRETGDGRDAWGDVEFSGTYMQCVHFCYDRLSDSETPTEDDFCTTLTEE